MSAVCVSVWVDGSDGWKGVVGRATCVAGEGDEGDSEERVGSGYGECVGCVWVMRVMRGEGGSICGEREQYRGRMGRAFACVLMMEGKGVDQSVRRVQDVSGIAVVEEGKG